jgi:hypothetical protein
MRSALVVGAFWTLALSAAAAPARAQLVAMPAEPQADAIGAASPAPPAETLTATYFQTGDAKSSLPKRGAWTFNKGLSVTCTKGCTVEFDAMVELGDNTAAANQWEICGVVDSKTLAGCPYQGTLPTNKTYVTGNYIGWTTLAQSSKAYLLQPGVYISAGPVGVAYYAVSYRIYRP